MLSLPSKPWKRVRIEALAEQRYRLVFLTELPSEAEFLESIEKDLRPALAPKDSLGSPDWPARSVTLSTSDVVTFKRNLVFACVMVEPN